jgi:hypothetical protein
MDYRHKSNVVALLDIRYTLRGEHARRNREREGNLNLERG